jgi:hypothetical protein
MATQSSQTAHSQSVSTPGSAGKDPALLKRRELAREINVSVRTLDNWQRKKIIPVIKISARCCRFRLGDVLRALDAFTVREAGR